MGKTLRPTPRADMSYQPRSYFKDWIANKFIVWDDKIDSEFLLTPNSTIGKFV